MGRRPNILILMTDQQRYDSLGCTGADFAHTPTLDRLASEGAVCENCIVNNPVCTPSRASLYTGKPLPGHGVYRLYDNLPAAEVLFTRRLQEAGYRTALFGKLHVSSRGYEESRRHPNDGFDVYEWCMEGGLAMDSPLQAYSRSLAEHHPAFHDRLKREFRDVLHHPSACHLTHWAAERTIDFLETHDPDRPFCCVTSVFDPHNPYGDFPEEAGACVDADAIPAPFIREGEFAGKPAALLREHHHSYLGDFAQYSRADLKRMRHGYHASIAFLDREFGRILDVLERRGLAENTLVIFTSDHGDMLGDHQLLVKGAYFYDPNVRVPLLLRWPGAIRAGTRFGGLVQLHDLAATVLSAAGLDSEAIGRWMPDSRNLLPALRGDTQRVRETAVCCYRNSGISSEESADPYFDPPIHATMLRTERWKLNLWHGVEPGTPAGELYDMQQDPWETETRWDDPACREVRLALTERLLEWLARWERETGSRGGECRPAQMLKNKPVPSGP